MTDNNNINISNNKQETFLSSTGHDPQTFSHLFPPVQPMPPPSSSSKLTLNKNAGIDYVIKFKFPTSSKNKSRQQLEQHVTKSLKDLTTRLNSAGLRYQIRSGKEPDTLLIFISSPIQCIKKEFRRER